MSAGIILPSLSDLETKVGSLSGVRVIVRCDFNVPVADGRIVDMFRIDQALPTLRFLRERGAKIRIVSRDWLKTSPPRMLW